MITKDNYKYFNLSAIETACNIPKRTIIQYVQGTRNLPTKHSDKLNEFLTNLIGCNTEQIKPIDEIKPEKKVKQISGCVNIKDYKLLLSGKYQHIKSGDKVTLIKKDNQYFIA